MIISRLSARVLVAACLAAVTGLTVAWPGFAAASAALASAPGRARWTIVPGPGLAPDNSLFGVAAVSRQLAWAVGTEGFSSKSGRPGRPVIERWNGRSWSAVRLPAAWTGDLSLVAAGSARDAWALGGPARRTGFRLLHWGGLRWRPVAFPGAPDTIYTDLGLAAAPGGRAWLIASPVRSAQIFGWGGARWRQQPYQCPGVLCNLFRISARTGSDAWAVGNSVTGSGTPEPLALHWTGRAWQQTPVPAVKNGYLTGVVAISRTQSWAVGGVLSTGQALLFRWNGTAWHRVTTPSGLSVPPLGELTGITGDPAGHLWIFDLGPQPGTVASYLRFDGHHWSMVSGALVNGESRVIVEDMAPIPGTSATWSAGIGFVPPMNARARIERYG